MSTITAFTPLPQNVGEEYVQADHTLPATPFTSAGVANIVLPTTRDLQTFKGAQVILAGTVPAGTNSCTLQIRKRLVGGAFVALSPAVSAFGRAQFDTIELRDTGPTRDRTLGPGELLVLTVDNTGGTVTTQPTLVHVASKLAVLR